MITLPRNITAASPTTEVWKYLRLFLSTDRTVERIRAVHTIGDEQRRNAEKQARQIAYCIRQGEQYFKAALSVDITTRPVLLYYGATSLGQALVLLNNDGNYSLDKLRANRKHHHHGLDVHNVESAAKAKTFCDFWRDLSCSVHVNNAHPWGQFPLFYKSLEPDVFSYAVDIYKQGETAHLTKQTVQPCADLRPIEELMEHNIECYSLIKGLPDMYWTMSELGEVGSLYRGTISRNLLKSAELSNGRP